MDSLNAKYQYHANPTGCVMRKQPDSWQTNSNHLPETTKYIQQQRLPNSIKEINCGTTTFNYRTSAFSYRITTVNYRMTAFSHRMTDDNHRITTVSYRTTAVNHRITGFSRRITACNRRMIAFSSRITTFNQRIAS